jgi:hypothetical protein
MCILQKKIGSTFFLLNSSEGQEAEANTEVGDKR